MKRAVLSDIHANLEALQAVLEDIRSQGVDEIYCLGDIIGYGPNPYECIELAKPFQLCLRGDHDLPTHLDSRADAFDTAKQFLSRLPHLQREPDLLFVHGSARNPLNEYVFPEDVCNSPKMQANFACFDRWCFQGHTHIPGVFTQSLEFHAPPDIGFTYHLQSGKAMINVGSVGQPRDGDLRAGYVIVDGCCVTFRRVEYPFEQTLAKLGG